MILEYVKEIGLWAENYIVELIKMYLLIRYMFGGKLRWENKKWVNVTHIILFIEIVAVSATQLSISHKNMIFAITTIVYCMLRFKNIFLATLSYLFFTFFDYGIGLLLIWLFQLDYQTAYESDIFGMIVGIISLLILVSIVLCRKYICSNHERYMRQRDIVFWNYLMFGGLLCAVPLATMIFQRKLGYLQGRVILGITLIVAIILIFYQRYRNIRSEKELYKREVDLQQKMFKQQKKYYQLMIEKDREIKKFRHDISSHIRCISELEDKKKYVELHEYMGEMSSKIKELKPVIATGNEIVNIVVNDIMQGRNIKLHWEGLCPAQLNMEQSEVCILFSNLLKNAVEAVEKTEKKEIWVHIKEYEQHLMIEVKNPVQSKVKIVNNKIATSKKDKSNHGYGLENVSDIVEKYQGEIEFETDEELFAIKVMLQGVLYIYHDY